MTDHGRPYTIKKIKELVVPIARLHGVEKLALFGSYANNTADRYSDIDFLVSKGHISGAWAYAAFIMALEEALDAKVDVITYDSAKRSQMAHILDNEVILYEQQG